MIVLRLGVCDIASKRIVRGAPDGKEITIFRIATAAQPQ